MVTVRKSVRREPGLRYQSRQHLTRDEVESLVAAARERGRHGHRDATMIQLAYRHGLRVTELVSVTWDQFDLDAKLFHVRRLKNGDPSTQPLGASMTRALRQIRREQRDYVERHVFMTERGGPMTAAGFTRLLARTAAAISFPLKIHPHMLRHACGYKLVNDGVDTRTIQAYLGHRNIQHTVHYTQLAHGRFTGLWDD